MMAETDIGGFVRFHIAISPQDMKQWSAEAIKQFFAGLAMIVYAAGKNATVEVVQLKKGESNDHQPPQRTESSKGGDHYCK